MRSGGVARRGRLPVVVTVLLVLLGGIGVDVDDGTPPGDHADTIRPAPPPGAPLERLWSPPARAEPAPGADTVYPESASRVWERTLVMGAVGSGVTAYDLRTGAAQRLPAPEVGATVCTMSSGIAGTVGVVLWSSPGPNGACDLLTAYDVRTRAEVWTRRVPALPRWAAVGTPIVLADGVVAMGAAATADTGTGARLSTVAAYDLADGSARWSFPVPAHDAGAGSGRTWVQALTSGPSGLLVGSSASSGREESSYATRLDPRTGAVRWSRRVMGGGTGDGGLFTIVSADPPVLIAHMRTSEEGAPRILVLDDHGRITRRIPPEGPWGSLALPYRAGDDRGPRSSGMCVADGVLYAPARAGTYTGRDRHLPLRMVALDLDTGRARWVSDSPGSDRMFDVMLIAGVDENHVYTVVGDSGRDASGAGHPRPGPHGFTLERRDRHRAGRVHTIASAPRADPGTVQPSTLVERRGDVVALIPRAYDAGLPAVYGPPAIGPPPPG
ncbi:PQQ-binding-like beta-propeller repeat protein [Embleya sp. NPDC059237]|uniref:outer membrane protein assembly factor BamB family protein n=1 Tax=Embleya sp. NPDC059237 TaxID=3346784 RepID=UPI003682C926